MRTIFYCAIICFTTVVMILSSVVPEVLSDRNSFLKGFVNHEILNVLGVIVTITLASAANIHLKFNDIEEKYRTPGGLRGTRGRVHQASFWLISLFLSAIVVVVVKPYFIGVIWAESLLNGLSLLILFWHVLIMISITRLIFSLKPDVGDDN